MYGETHVINILYGSPSVRGETHPLTCDLQQILQIDLLSPIKLITIPLDHPTEWDTESRHTVDMKYMNLISSTNLKESLSRTINLLSASLMAC